MAGFRLAHKISFQRSHSVHSVLKMNRGLTSLPVCRWAYDVAVKQGAEPVNSSESAHEIGRKKITSRRSSNQCFQIHSCALYFFLLYYPRLILLSLCTLYFSWTFWRDPSVPQKVYLHAQRAIHCLQKSMNASLSLSIIVIILLF